MKTLILAAINCSLVFLGADISGWVAEPTRQTRTLTFGDRVAYQRAIEDVYWRHRIWPKERPDPKPALDTVMSQAQLEKKVTEYLCNSQALEDYWQTPITADQLQAEMERMAQHTKQPDVLRELFAALGNDPFAIAECLAKPVLIERFVADLSAQDKRGPFGSAPTKALRSMPMTATLTNVAYTLPRVAEGSAPCTDDTWTATSTINTPHARYLQTAVWTGSEMIVWGGFNGSSYVNTGGRYNPGTDTWTATSTINAPDARYLHTAVWTGSEMIVWGGFGSTVNLNTGGRYNPSTNSWTATSTTNAPDGRYDHTAVWTGSEMIVWGGYAQGWLNTGGRYNPGTDSWTATSITNAPNARSGHTAVWTGSEMIVWGGHDGSINFNTGGRYNPSTNSWTATSTTNVPDARNLHTAVWTGSEMIVWGGFVYPENLNTGGRYNPRTDSWTATSTTNVPEARQYHTAVWTGSEMIVWGGFGSTNLNTGGRYNPSTNSWTATSTTNAPVGRFGHTAVWTGSEMIVWGGQNGIAPFYLNTGGRYCAAAPTPRPITVTFSTNPAGRSYTVDGISYNSAHVFSWRSGSSHTIATTSPQSGGSGVRYVWQNWSDNGTRSHTIAPSTSTAYTATFTTQYYLTMNAGAGGTVTPASGWRSKGAQVTIRATPSNGYHFTGWTGSGNGSYSGTNNPASVTMNAPIVETASFSQ